MNDKKVPQLFVNSGATKWDDPKGHSWTMGFFVSYQAEERIYAAYILKNKPDGKIGVLYQNDDFGKDYVKGLVDGLGNKAASMIKVKTFCQTTETTVDSEITEMKSAAMSSSPPRSRNLVRRRSARWPKSNGSHCTGIAVTGTLAGMVWFAAAHTLFLVALAVLYAWLRERQRVAVERSPASPNEPGRA